jgi:uncharacterized radical SAM superfamily Fe-S cluster-containing enzyme
MSSDHRDYTFLGTTQSLCPECLAVVPAKIIARRGRVYFRKTCPEHGTRDDFICSDAAQYDQMQFALPARMPAAFGVEPERGCPLDCGLCTEHEQHTCVGVLEITSSCNLTCPLCYAASSPGGKHLSLADCRRQIDRLVEVEGRAEVCQLSGGEPTIHPQLGEIVEYALSREIDYVMINTNGIRFARDTIHRSSSWPPGTRTGWKSISSSTACPTTCTWPFAASRSWRRSRRPWRPLAGPGCTSPSWPRSSQA